MSDVVYLSPADSVQPARPRDHRDLAIEQLTEELLLAEAARDQALAQAAQYRRLALSALDYARAIHITADDTRDQHIARQLTAARDAEVDRRLEEVA